MQILPLSEQRSLLRIKKEVDDSPPPGNQVQLSAFGETSGILQAHSQNREPHKSTGTESCQMFSFFSMFWNEASLSWHLPPLIISPDAWGLIPDAATAGRKNLAWAVTSAYVFIKWLQFFIQPDCLKYLQCRSCQQCDSVRHLSEVSESEKSAMKVRPEICRDFIYFPDKKRITEGSWKSNVHEIKET